MSRFYYFFVFIFLPLTLSAQTTINYKHNSKAPLEITSDEMNIDQEHGVIHFKGDVKVIQDKMTLTSKIMHAYFHKKQEANEPDIYKIEVEGNVHIITPKEKAKGDKGFYKVKEEYLELIGHVALQKEDTLVTGNKLTYSAKKGESSVTGGSSNSKSSRVKAIFSPKVSPNKL